MQGGKERKKEYLNHDNKRDKKESKNKGGARETSLKEREREKNKVE